MAIKKPKMVDWYNPVQLFSTGVLSVISSIIGRMLDPRGMVASGGANSDGVFDYSNEENFSFDYIADTGDGWDSTYSMAYLTTMPEMEIADADLKLPRAKVLIMGGDQVYPVASKEEYEQRLSNPFKTAAKHVREKYGNGQPRNDVFLIPGNHDWYDALASMTSKYFAYTRESKDLNEPIRTIRPKLGQFETCQQRGYFVLKLPNNWEVWCVDIQLGNDIDRRQRGFFRWHAEDLSPQTKVIICSAIPTIVYGSDREQRIERDSLVFGLHTITRAAYDRGARVMVSLAGDVHNYQHYRKEETTKSEQTYQREHIVCGGGGAFLHPTHGFNKGSDDDERVEPIARYPSREQSKKLSNSILKFPFAHWGMSLVLALLYLAMFWQKGPPGFNSQEIIKLFANQPGSVLCMLLAIGGCTAFGSQKRWWGALHGVAHIMAAVLCWWLARMLLSHFVSSSELEIFMVRGAVIIIGMLVGGLLFGLYLWLSLNVFRVHHNEAFSAIGSPHYKCMLRCKVEDDGSLTMHAIGIEATAGEEASHPVKTHLIETIRVS